MLESHVYSEKFNECDDLYMGIICIYPQMINKSTIKAEYLIPRAKNLFEVFKEEIQHNTTWIPENLIKYPNFDIQYYGVLFADNLYNESKTNVFIDLEKAIINKYKARQFKEVISLKLDFTETYKRLTEINNLKYNSLEVLKAKDIIEELTKKQQKIQLGFPYLDSALNLSRGDLLIVAGGTGTGKTTFALNLLSNLSKDYQCVYINLEMTKAILYKRLSVIETGIEIQKLNDITMLSREEKYKLNNCWNDLESRNIIIENNTFVIEEIKKEVMNIPTNKHIVVFIDHIGLLKGKGNGLYEKTTNIAKDLRRLSLETNCTVMCLCQLSRESQRRNEEPTLQDLRDSGEIEQSARKVILLHNKTEERNNRVYDMNLIIAKNDDGNKIKKSFRFDRFVQKFSENYNGGR